MNGEQIRSELQTKYPDRPIIQLPPDNPTEIICEIEPTNEHPQYSVAIAVIEESKPHLHRRTVETYKVIQGEVELHLDQDIQRLNAGDVHIIQPNIVHWATGNEAWVEVSSSPGWTPDDHILIDIN